MRVAVGDEVAARKPGPEPFVPPRPRPRVVDDPDSEALPLHDEPLRKLGANLRLVHVSVHRLDVREGLKLGEDRPSGKVAHVEDELRPLEHADARRGKPADAVAKVGIADERDQKVPSRKRPSR